MKQPPKKLWIILAIILVAILAISAIWWDATHGNRQLVDNNYRYDRAIIRLPNGEIIEGKVNSWLDYADSDVVQVKVDGKTYLTHYSNVCLIDD
ncbi:MAG: hypothetical protein IKP40_06545 [Clostridia bacterium]|nr:hypothetical protein [Clostridia bacterium]